MTTQVLPLLDQEVDARIYDLVNCRAEDQAFYTDEQEAEAYAFIEEHKQAIWEAYHAEMGDGEPAGEPICVRDIFNFLVNTYID